jgi:hypothetical protein
MSGRVSKLERAEAVARLSNVLSLVPLVGERREIYVFTVKRGASAHDFTVAVVIDDQLAFMTQTVAHACGYRLVDGWDRDAVRLRGLGMDMRVELVDTIMRTADWGPDWQSYWTVRS